MRIDMESGVLTIRPDTPTETYAFVILSQHRQSAVRKLSPGTPHRRGRCVLVSLFSFLD